MTRRQGNRYILNKKPRMLNGYKAFAVVYLRGGARTQSRLVVVV